MTGHVIEELDVFISDLFHVIFEILPDPLGTHHESVVLDRKLEGAIRPSKDESMEKARS